MKKTFVSLILILCQGFTLVINGQILFPPEGILFNDNSVKRIAVFINPDSLDALLASGNEYSNHEYPATFVFANGIDSDTIDNVGFRLRGNTSRVSAKKSFKISFNTFLNGDFYGVEKLNLNGEHNDPSIARSKICWDICNDFDVVGSRCNPIEFYINNEYKGLYVNVEHVDEEFIDVRFGNKSGNLYKCLWPADLTYKGSDPNLYKEVLYGRRAYDLKTNTQIDDYSDLANFIDILNNASLSNLPYDLEEVLNVPGCLRYLAVEIYTGHWDGYSYNKNNFYLYNDPETGVFHIIPYDLDNTLGIDWMGRNWATRDINDWANHGEYRPLIERLMQVQEYKDWFNFYINKLINEVCDTSVIFPVVNNYRILVKDFVVNDIYHSMDYGYTYNDFMNSFDTEQGGHVTYGIKPYFSERQDYALLQLDINDINPIISNVMNNHPGPQQLVNVIAKVEDENLPDVWLYYSLDQLNWDSIQMHDNALYNDGPENDENWGINIGPFNMGSQIDYFIEAEDINGNISRFPRAGYKSVNILTFSSTALVINEYMAKNSSVISDQDGNFDDWIEIFNTGTNPVYLGDKFLSDNSNQPAKWQMPAITLGAGEYYLIWADKEEAEGIDHANFKLSSQGEEILIVESDGTTIIDYVEYYWQNEDLSEGRYPNGTGPVQALGLPTPGYSNELMSIPQEEPSETCLIYPNPFFEYCTVEIPGSINHKKLLQVFAIDGKLLFEKSFADEQFVWNSRTLNETLPPGIYIFIISGQNSNLRISEKVIKF